MARTRQTRIPVESSWRMVEEGENDSFDTSIVYDAFDDEFISSGQSQLSSNSTQPFASQDSIRDFANQADEDQVILRAPFQPSLSSTRQASADKERTPVPEFFMPTIDVDSPRHGSGRSSRTIQPPSYESQPTRRRAFRQDSLDGSPRKRKPPLSTRPSGHTFTDPSSSPSPYQRFSSTFPEVMFNSAAWIVSIVGMALRYAKFPLAIVLALYMCIGAGMIAKNMITDSIATSLSPLCRLPLVDFPFCPAPSMPMTGSQDSTQPVEFDELMNVQSQFEKVLEDSASGVSLPMEMKRTEASVRDLRTMVKYSDIPARDELVYEMEGYIETVRITASDLQAFNTHVGSAVDNVISINRWTSRYIDTIAANREANDNLLSKTLEWLFSPFQPAVFDERILLDKYVEHTALVSDKIGHLILEAQNTLRLLGQAENHLDLIKEITVREGKAAKSARSDVFWDIWTLLGANNARLHNLRAQLSLLHQVEHQRSTAQEQVMGLLHDLGDIQTKLGDLRERVAAPELLQDKTSIPLSVHIETINAGVERLESARSRIRAEENERLQRAMAMAREREEDRLIEG
ncbi:hypothetical protein F5Y15DRAFT_126591 [Xylariaceae sp. FL0016]|nr:hypothetical protein F5Y15DRAFT_126591 [Xylariaceae sp. FL0016]